MFRKIETWFERQSTQKRLVWLGLFLVFVTTFLTISYAFNSFKVTDENYRSFAKNDEAMIIGRVIGARHHGFFYKGGLPGWPTKYDYKLKEGDPLPQVMTMEGIVSFDLLAFQRFDDFIQDRQIEIYEWHNYKTMPAGQSSIYTLLDKILPINSNIKLSIFRMFTILLSVLCLVLFIHWTIKNYGIIPGLIVFALIFISPWFFRFVYNLWWALWTYYIPFITMLLILDRKRKSGKVLLDMKVYAILFCTIFLKFFFTGADFMTSSLVMAICPIIYHLIVVKVDLKSSITYLVKSSIACLLGLCAGFLFLVGQIRLLEGTWSAGFDHILLSFVKRSALSETAVDLKTLDVIWMYFGGEVFYYPQFPSIHVSFGALFLLICLLSVCLFFLSKKYDNANDYLKNKALIITATISILGPFSWIGMFIEHANEHIAFDYIVWYMPYLLYGYAIIGVFVQILFRVLRKSKIQNQLVAK